eukprot:IDg16818t1
MLLVRHHVRAVACPHKRTPPPPTCRSRAMAPHISNAERSERLQAAVALIVSGSACGKVSVRRAASIHGVAKSTLHRHISAIRAARRSQPPTIKTPRNKCGISFLVHHDESLQCALDAFPARADRPAQLPMSAAPALTPH